MTRQARDASMRFADWGVSPPHLLTDHDTKFVTRLDEVPEADGVEVKRVGAGAPDPNASAARGAQSPRREALDHFVVLGERHLRHPAGESVERYDAERPPRGLGNVPLGDDPPPADSDGGAAEPVVPPFPKRVERRERLGGLLKHFRRAA